MQDTPTALPCASAPRWWTRLHAALMPDYNRAAATYWWSMVGLGVLILGLSLDEVARMPWPAQTQVAVGVLLAAVAGFFPVRIPRSTNSFAAGEVFIFLLLLLHGPAAACTAAAGEAFIGSSRTSRRWTSRIASPALATVAMWAAGTPLVAALAWLEPRITLGAGVLMVASVLFATVYFVLNTALVTLVLVLKRGDRLDPGLLMASFSFAGMTYWFCAAVASLLYLSYRQNGISVVMAAVPIIAMLVATLHFYFRQQAADEATRKSRMEAAEREAEQAARHVQLLQSSEQRFHSAFTHASIGMLLVSTDLVVLQTNNALKTLLGDAADQLPGRDARSLFHDEDRAAVVDMLSRLHGGDNDTATLELRCQRLDGVDVWVSLHASFFSDVRSQRPSLILQMQDISARRNAESRLEHIAFHDGLTGLPNRARLLDHLRKALEAAHSVPGRHFALMFLDFDRFKIINDSFGHAAGDQFLVQVAQRIQASVRPGDVVARLGGDEFVVLVHKVDDEVVVTHLAERLQKAIARPISIAGTEVFTSASIGITFSRFGYQAPGDLLRDADIAMYRAKSAGKARHAVYDVALHAHILQRVRLEGDLRSALAAGTLDVHYQPIYELQGLAPIAFEALARWHHPELGMISPAEFVPIAEESGLVLQLTDHVMDLACRDLRRWQSLDAAFQEMSVQVNLSGPDVAHPQLVQRVLQVLARHGLQPHHLKLELTENILVAHLESARETLATLNRLGVSLSVDDFGTGYSSLSHLTGLPVDSLKIDRSFVARIDGVEATAEFLRAIVMLGRSLGKNVVAEGIETDTQLQVLRDIGCDQGQGYLLAQPMPRDAIEHALARPGPSAPRPQSSHSRYLSEPGLLH